MSIRLDKDEDRARLREIIDGFRDRSAERFLLIDKMLDDDLQGLECRESVEAERLSRIDAEEGRTLAMLVLRLMI